MEIRHLEALRSLAPVWDELAAENPCPTADHDWAVACAEAFADGDLRVAVAAREGEALPVGVAPLVASRFRASRELLGVRLLGEPTDLLYRGAEGAAALAEELVAAGVLLRLPRLPGDSQMPAALRGALRGRGRLLVREAAGTPYVELDESWREPERRLSSRRRSDLRRARRRAEELGPVRVEVLAPTEDEAGPLLEEALRVEEASWKGEAGTALLRDPRRLDFFRRYAALAAARGSLRIAFLRIGGRAAAMQIASERGARLWLLKIGYDPAFARASPGTLLMLETIADSARRGLTSYELLGNPAAWTDLWAPAQRRCVAVVAVPRRARAIAGAVGLGFERALRRVRR